MKDEDAELLLLFVGGNTVLTDVNILSVFQESDLASVIVGLIQVVFTAVAALIMDKAGRKVLLIISGTFIHH